MRVRRGKFKQWNGFVGLVVKKIKQAFVKIFKGGFLSAAHHLGLGKQRCAVIRTVQQEKTNAFMPNGIRSFPVFRGFGEKRKCRKHVARIKGSRSIMRIKPAHTLAN